MNIIKSVLSILFPLITLPYISRVLTQDSIGEYTYATSIINYYILISGLGIKTFAIREAVNHRANKDDFDNFASEMFSLNLFFTVVAYILLALSYGIHMVSISLYIMYTENKAKICKVLYYAAGILTIYGIV